MSDRESGFLISGKISTFRELAAWMDLMKDRERERVRLLSVQWLESIAAYHGYHDLKASQDLKLFQRLSRRQENELNDIGMNFVMPHVRTLVTKIISSRPIVRALPASTDEGDIQAAKFSTQFLTGEWQQQEMDIRKVEVAVYVAATGNAFGHEFLDSRLGLPVFDGVAEGRMQTEILSPLKVCLEPHRSDVRKCRWAIISQFAPIDQIEEMYGDEYETRTGRPLILKGIEKTGSSTKARDMWVRSYLNMVGAVDHRDTSLDESDYCEVDLLYFQPTKRYPEGMMAVKVGNEIVSFGRYPYPWLERLPILHFREMMAPWRLYGEASVNEVMKNQDMYIRLRRIERDYHLQNTRSKLMVPKGARVSRDKLASNETEVIDFVSAPGGDKPYLLPPTGVPGSIYQSLKLTADERQILGGISDATNSLPPSGVTSGKALLSLQEQDNSRLLQPALLAEAEWGEWGRITLLMGKNLYPERRKYAIAGESGAGSVFFFDRAEIGDTTDVICVPRTGLPENELAKKEQIRADFVAGIYGNPADPSSGIRVRKMLASSLPEDVQDDENVHQQVTEKENINMVNMARSIMKAMEAQGFPPSPEMFAQAIMPIQDFDSDEIHIRGHIRRLNSAGVVDNPMIYWVLAKHTEMHFQRMQARMAPPPQLLPPPGSEQGGQPQAKGRTTTEVARSIPKGGSELDSRKG